MPPHEFLPNLSPSDLAHSRDAATDALMDSYVAWREASGRVWGTYERWREWDAHDGSLAYDAYMVALEHEEHAARMYEESIGRWTGLAGGPAELRSTH